MPQMTPERAHRILSENFADWVQALDLTIAEMTEEDSGRIVATATATFYTAQGTPDAQP